MEAKEMKAVLLHLGANMFRGWLPEDMDRSSMGKAAPDLELKTTEAQWREAVDYAAAKGLNTVVVDLGEAIAWPSHPELAVRGSWAPDKMKAEVARMRKLGLEPIPKLNFSATHDSWLKEYHLMLSTKEYYGVCRDLIRDAAEMFSCPRFLHIGFDEETVGHQIGWGTQGIACVRQGELWWHDFLWFVKTVEEAGMRTWMWSDRGWHHPDFVTRCPKSVLQSNWYYDEEAEGFDPEKGGDYTQSCLKLYLSLDKAGFDQVPCGSNWNSGGRKKKGRMTNETIVDLVSFCRKNISREHLKGFLQTSWVRLYNDGAMARTKAGIDLLAPL